MTALRLADAVEADFGLLAKLHQRLLPTSQLSLLGQDFISGVYYPALLGNKLGGAIIAYAGDEAAGFASYTTDTPSFLGHVADRKMRTLLALARELPRSPVNVASAVISSFSTYSSLEDEPHGEIKAEFLSLGVEPKFRDPAFIRQSGISIAKSLFRATQERLGRLGVETFRLFPPQADQGSLGPSLLYVMLGAKMVWEGSVRKKKLRLYLCPAKSPASGKDRPS
jgi:hypothetical protein